MEEVMAYDIVPKSDGEGRDDLEVQVEVSAAGLMDGPKWLIDVVELGPKRIMIRLTRPDGETIMVQVDQFKVTGG